MFCFECSWFTNFVLVCTQWTFTNYYFSDSLVLLLLFLNLWQFIASEVGPKKTSHSPWLQGQWANRCWYAQTSLSSLLSHQPWWSPRLSFLDSSSILCILKFPTLMWIPVFCLLKLLGMSPHCSKGEKTWFPVFWKRYWKTGSFIVQTS